MACVAVTRSGYGGLWLFESRSEAETHPLVQYGDSLICGPDDVLTQYNLLDLWWICQAAGGEFLKKRVMTGIPAQGVVRHSKRVEAAREFTGEIWEHLLSAAQPPPEDDAAILYQIRLDRRAVIEEGVRRMADAKKEAAKTESKKEAPAKTAKYADADTIHMLSDKDGKAYGKDNNPKREGSASAQRFALYKDGMSVKQFVDKGGKLADISWDVSKGFIKIEKAPAKAA